jgi:BNR repeat-like domain
MSAAILLAAGLITFAGVQPQLAGRGSQVYLAFGAGDVVSVARSADAGATFETPVALPGAGKLALGAHRGPRIAATRDAVLVAAIAGAKGGGADGDVVLYRSTDQGRTWSAPTIINAVPGAAREGLHGLAANAAGVVAIAWLDLREKGTRIYAAVSRDDGVTWRESLVYASPSGVCECCHPSVAVGDDGRVAVMFRNHLEGRRDMYVIQLRDGAVSRPHVKQGKGSWPLEACPMDGGAIAIDATGTYAVWRREMTIFATTTAVGAPESSAEQPLGTGRDPVLARLGRGVDVAWTGEGRIVLRQAGKPAAAIGPGRFASLLALPTHTLLASEDHGRVSVRAVPR